MTQRGIAPIFIVIAAAILVGGGVFVGKLTLFPDKKNDTEEIIPPTPSVQTQSPMPSSNSKSTAKPGGGIPINVTTTVVSPKPVSSPAPGSTTPPPPPAAPEIIINAAGSYSYSGQQINYAISFPKNGGDVSGTISGVCNGPITGTFSGGDGGMLTSNVNAKCNLGLLTQDLKADFEGKVYFSQGKADVEWKGEIPFYSGSKEFSLTFPPL